MQNDHINFALATIATASGPAAAMVIGDRVAEIAALTRRERDRSVLTLASDWEANLSRLDAIAARALDSGKPLDSAELRARPQRRPRGATQ